MMSIKEKLLRETMVPWLDGSGVDADIVLSSRVRLARNLAAYPFPNRAQGNQLRQVLEEVRETVDSLKLEATDSFSYLPMTDFEAFERNILVEKHFVSPNFAAGHEERGLLLSDDASVSVMVNEEDHLRIQCMQPGLALQEALQRADAVDDQLEAVHDFAFGEQWGYLTACPTNVGTGLRASVMLHLPALAVTKQIGHICEVITQLGLAVRGIYGEGTEAIGNIFQISNQLTLGHSEQEIVQHLHGVVTQVVGRERASREVLEGNSRPVIEDRIWRSYGILRYAHNISGQEALAKLSEVRLGIDLGIIEAVPSLIFNELMVTTRPNYLRGIAAGKELRPGERSRLRARVIRDTLRRMEGEQDV